MRRLISILLLAVLGLPFALPLLAANDTSESRLPACCRRNGAHHCSMMMDGAEQGVHFQKKTERCPMYPRNVSPQQHDALGLAAENSTAVDMVDDFAGARRTESMRRIARERSRHKRGPPSLA